MNKDIQELLDAEFIEAVLLSEPTLQELSKDVLLIN
jgi:hypothetical protein